LQGHPVTVYKPGTQLRSILYVDDAVEALLAAAQCHKAIGRTFFAVGDKHYSVINIAERTTSVIGGSVRLVEWPKERKAIEVGDAVISNAEIKKVLGWRPLTDLDQGLENTSMFFRDKLDCYLK